MKRKVFHSTHSKDSWRVLSGGKTVSTHDTQKESEAAAKTAGRREYERGGLGQAVLHKKNGTIRTEHTYGKDPERTRG